MTFHLTIRYFLNLIVNNIFIHHIMSSMVFLILTYPIVHLLHILILFVFFENYVPIYCFCSFPTPIKYVGRTLYFISHRPRIECYSNKFSHFSIARSIEWSIGNRCRRISNALNLSSGRSNFKSSALTNDLTGPSDATLPCPVVFPFFDSINALSISLNVPVLRF